MNKFKLIFIAIMLLIMTFPQVAHAEEKAPNIYINDILMEFPVGTNQPIVRNFRVLVPLRSGFFSELGGAVTYDNINREATVKTTSHAISNYMQELDIYNLGMRCYIADVRSEYLNGDAYVPLRAFCESLGLTVEYNDTTYSIKIR